MIPPVLTVMGMVKGEAQFSSCLVDGIIMLRQTARKKDGRAAIMWQVAIMATLENKRLSYENHLIVYF